MSGKPITFTEVFRRELAELRTRRRHRGQPEVGPPGPVEPDEGGATPHLFNALLDDLARRNGAFQPQASEAPA